MSLAADSPVHSSSSDDLAETLDAILDTASDGTDPEEVDESDNDNGDEAYRDNATVPLDAMLNTASDATDPEEVDEGDNGDEAYRDLDLERVKRRKVELSESIINMETSSSQGKTPSSQGETTEALGGAIS